MTYRQRNISQQRDVVDIVSSSLTAVSKGASVRTSMRSGGIEEISAQIAETSLLLKRTSFFTSTPSKTALRLCWQCGMLKFASTFFMEGECRQHLLREAASDFQHCLDKGDIQQRLQAHRYLASAYLALNEPHKALSLFSLTLMNEADLGPNERFVFARSLVGVGEFGRAIAELTQLVIDVPTHMGALALRAQAYGRQGDTLLATVDRVKVLLCYHECLSLYSAQAHWASESFAQTYMTNGAIPKRSIAQRLCDEGLQSVKDNPWSACDKFRKSILADPTFEDAYLHIIDVYQRAEAVVEASAYTLRLAEMLLMRGDDRAGACFLQVMAIRCRYERKMIAGACISDDTSSLDSNNSNVIADKDLLSGPSKCNSTNDGAVSQLNQQLLFLHQHGLGDIYYHFQSDSINTMRQLWVAIEAELPYATSENPLGVILNARDPTRAIEFLTRQAEASGDVSSYRGLSQLLLRECRYSDAVRFFTKAYSLDRNDSSIPQGLGKALHGMGRLEEALTAYETAAALDPTIVIPETLLCDVRNRSRVDALVTEACTRMERGKLDGAIASLNKAVDLFNNHTQAHALLGECWERKCTIQLAPSINILGDGWVNELCGTVRYPTDLLLIEGQNRMRTQQYSAAIALFGEAICRFHLVQGGLFSQYIDSVTISESLLPREMAQCGLVRQPDYTLAMEYNITGYCLESSGRLDHASIAYDLALQLDPDYRPAKYNLSRLEKQVLNIKQAIHHYNTADRLGHPDAKRGVARLLIYQGRFLEAHNQLLGIDSEKEEWTLLNRLTHQVTHEYEHFERSLNGDPMLSASADETLITAHTAAYRSLANIERLRSRVIQVAVSAGDDCGSSNITDAELEDLEVRIGHAEQLLTKWEDRLHVHNPHYLLCLGVAYIRAEKIDSAIYAFELFFRGFQRYLNSCLLRQALFHFLLAARRQNTIDVKMNQYRKHVRTNPRLYGIFYAVMAELFHEHGKDDEKAKEVMKLAISLFPEEQFLYQRIASLLHNCGRYSDAELQGRLNGVNADLVLGIMYQADQPKKALSHLEAAVVNEPDSPLAQFYVDSARSDLEQRPRLTQLKQALKTISPRKKHVRRLSFSDSSNGNHNDETC